MNRLHLLAAAIFVAAVAASNANLLPRMRDSLPGGLHPDPLLHVWILDHEIRHLERLDFTGFWDAGVCYPETRWSMTRLPVHLALAALGLPVYLLSGRDIVLTYNFVYLSSFLLAAAAAYALCWHLTRSWPAALLGGLIFSSNPYILGHRNHFETLSTAPLALCFLGLLLGFGQRRNLGLALAALALVLQFHACLYYGIFLSSFASLFCVASLWRLAASERPRVLLSLAWASGIAALGILPLVWAYSAGHREMGLHARVSESDWYAAQLQNFLAAPDSILLGAWTRPLSSLETSLFPGLTATFLAVLGLRRGGEGPGGRSPLGAWLGCGVLLAGSLSLGNTIRLFDQPLAPGPYRLISSLPGYIALRAPGRFGALYFLFLAVLASFGLARLCRQRAAQGRPLWPLAGGVLLAWAIETSPVPTALQPAALGPDLPEVHHWLARQPRGPFSVLELPSDGASLVAPHQPMRQMRALMNSLVHGHPVPWLSTGYLCTQDLPLADLAPADRAGKTGLIDPRLLAETGVRYLVVHRDGLPADADLERLEQTFPAPYRDARTVVLDLPFWKSSQDADRLDRSWLRLQTPEGWSPAAPLSMERYLELLPPGYPLVALSYDEAANALYGPPLEQMQRLGLGTALRGRYGAAYAALTTTTPSAGPALEKIDGQISRLVAPAGTRVHGWSVPQEIVVLGSANRWHGGLLRARIQRGWTGLYIEARGLSFLLLDPETLETIDLFSFDTHQLARPKSSPAWLHPGPAVDLRLPPLEARPRVLSLGLRLESGQGRVRIEQAGRELAAPDLDEEARDIRIPIDRDGPLLLHTGRPLVMDWARLLRRDG